jgi:hypothetical protein
LPAARRLGLELQVLNASAESDFDAVFAKKAKANPPGLGQSERAAWIDAGWMGAGRADRNRQ